MIRAPTPPFVTLATPTVSGWAIPHGPVATDAAAVFMAGAALNALDVLVRSDPPWAGAWRQRLALRNAVAAVRLAGRIEDEAALRDVWNLRPPGADLSAIGPAGGILAAWRRLVSRVPELDADMLAGIVDLFGLRWGEFFASVADQVVHLVEDDDGRPAPYSAAAIVAYVYRARLDAEPLGWWLADLVLARKLRWPRPVPLLMAQVFTPAFQTEGGRGIATRIRPGEQNFERAVCLALAHGATEACRLGTELGRRADRLLSVAPKLRAKGAGEAIEKLLDDDAVSGALVTKNLSRFASRRLFERLRTLDAVRELSGRSTFRLYGL
ncbi:DUF1403 family protein [Mesorhizobium argentiipisi]|uniref:DUF1403 family protein n=1 Tax=Mesorhizobium argentiipisi TaxID=3015175 RepID=A0ABU8KCV0_9HYPH